MISADWQPHVPTLQAADGVYASRFPARAAKRCGCWSTAAAAIPPAGNSKCRQRPARATTTCGTASELKPADRRRRGRAELRDRERTATGRSWPSTATALPDRQFVRCCRAWPSWRRPAWPTSRPSGSACRSKIVDIPRPSRPWPAQRPGRHGADPRPASIRFKVSGVEIEGERRAGRRLPVSLGGSAAPAPRQGAGHQGVLHRQVPGHQRPVQEVPRRLAATGPSDDHNFLKDWHDGRLSAKAGTSKPVTWVSLEDARAYAAWAGKRLPHEWEWQYAAQGTDGRPYPWGNEPDASAHAQARRPAASCARPTDVDAYPQGASPFGVMDMVGNVWQWTDEYRGRAHAGGRPSRRRLLSPQRLEVVLSARTRGSTSTGSTVDGPVQGPLRDARLPLRRGCGKWKRIQVVTRASN